MNERRKDFHIQEAPVDNGVPTAVPVEESVSLTADERYKAAKERAEKARKEREQKRAKKLEDVRKDAKSAAAELLGYSSAEAMQEAADRQRATAGDDAAQHLGYESSAHLKATAETEKAVLQERARIKFAADMQNNKKPTGVVTTIREWWRGLTGKDEDTTEEDKNAA